jgi:hypothetical protein
MLIPAAHALAGSFGDTGTVPGMSPVGEVNWIAWQDDNLESRHLREILTEDSTNS